MTSRSLNKGENHDRQPPTLLNCDRSLGCRERSFRVPPKFDATCVVIRDVVEDDGEVIEDTKDWYAQDIHGNVWYFGEAVQDFENGELVSIDGSFTAGVNNAKAGIIMKAAPAVGDVYRQEFSLGNAEDAARVLSLTGSAAVPAARCRRDCLVTRDFTPLEPGVFERKFYAPGVGSILEVNPKTGKRLELVEIKN